MAHPNPTSLRVGATGTLDGRRLRVAGRVVLGVVDGGETYYWNEYNLADGFGRSAILVYEETEDGPEWKLFTWFEPLRALTVGEAAAKRVGDTVALDGRPARITLTGQSRVHFIEGTAPAGVDEGDTAHYFNVDTGPRMLVASWSGDEIEFYEGRDLTAGQVAAAFGLPAIAATPAASPSAAAESVRGFGGKPGLDAGVVAKIVGGVLAAIWVFSFFSGGSASTPGRSPSPPAKVAAPPPPLVTGARGMLAQATYTVTDHAVIEIARTGGRYDRHEYRLRDARGREALLIHGLTAGTRDWCLLHPLEGGSALAALTPYDAASRKKGATIALPDRALPIVELFQAKAGAREGAGAPATWPDLQYGLLAREGDDWLIARWTETEIRWHRGKGVPATEVLRVFGADPGRRP